MKDNLLITTHFEYIQKNHGIFYRILENVSIGRKCQKFYRILEIWLEMPDNIKILNVLEYYGKCSEQR